MREVLATEGILDDAEQGVNDSTLNFLVLNEWVYFAIAVVY